MLAKNLSINRNTVARAYSELRQQGHVESQRRRGMVVVGAAKAQERAQARTRARTVLATATRECVALGLAAEEISSLAYHFGLHAEQLEVKICFVECNLDRANYFADELSSRLEMTVDPLVLDHFNPDEAFRVDLILTTFFHLAEVRRLARGSGAEVVAIVVAPHVTTLVQLAKVPKSQTVGNPLLRPRIKPRGFAILCFRPGSRTSRSSPRQARRGAEDGRRRRRADRDAATEGDPER